MNQDPLKTLAQELKAAAKKYTQVTGKQFKASFEFVEHRPIQSEQPVYQIANVEVKTTEEVRA